MKKLNYLLAVCLLLSVVIFTGCKKDDPEPEETTIEKAVKALTKSTWTADKVMWNELDLVAEDQQYTDFTLKFSGDTNGGTYTATNGDPAFPKTSGSWKFAGEVNSATSFQIVRDGEIPMDVKVITGGMNLTFTIPSDNARTNGTVGEIQFQLVADN